MDLISEGIKQKLIRLEDDGKYIVYLHQEKRRNYSNPEEKVQAESFLSLVLIYKYPVKRIRQFVAVQMGSETKEADIIVYDDDALKSPFIVIECKKPDASELEFRRAADQAVSYAVADGARYVWVTSKLKNEYFEIPAKKPKDRITIPDVPQFGVTELARFKYAVGGGTTKRGQKLFPLELVTQDELTRRFQQAHQALWGGGELNPSEAFDELDKLIFCKLWDERKLRKPGDAYDFQIVTVKPKDESEQEVRRANEATNQNLLDRLKKLYEEGRKKDPEVFRDDIRLSAAKARTVVSYLESINLSDTDLDSKGRAFETFMGSFFRGDFGQYFTPRPIVKFIVDVLPITHESLVLDTSCGSGGFLLHALDKVRKQADDYFKPGTAKHHRHWHDFAADNLYGIEINEQIARTAKMNMIIHDDGHTNVIACDGLVPPSEIRAKTKNQGFKEGRFDFIITNPPFGSSVKQTEKAYMSQYRLATRDVDWLNPKSKAADRPGQDTEILFIEQCWNYLAEGGYLAVVIPDGILTNSSLQYVRDKIEEIYRIVAVISLPQTAFTNTGAGVKSSVLFLKKLTESETKRMRDTKQELKDSIRKKEEFESHLFDIEREKRKALQTLGEHPSFDNISAAKRRENPEYVREAKSISDRYGTKLDLLRYRLNEVYDERRRNVLPDYLILMAIADDIGYDATGRDTKKNELEGLASELSQFINAIEQGCDNTYKLQKAPKHSRLFLTRKSDATSRWDASYFRPELVALEKRVLKVTPLRLRDFVVQMAGGATPPTKEAETHYTEGGDGVPFIRVQNLSTTGQLNLDDCKQIRRETHEGLLGRSRLYGGELLVKITGVGRMAVASVVPEDFEGNINQHIVAIRTKNIRTSEMLAAYLNLDISEQLASRRSTGGTRPALDYPALLSIPVIADERIPKRINAAVSRAEELRRKANEEISSAKRSIEAMFFGEEDAK